MDQLVPPTNTVPLGSSEDPWAKSARAPKAYVRLTDTMRIYAGWLLAWYCIVVTLQSYARLRSITFLPDFLEEMFASQPLFLVSFACFLFLLGTSVHQFFKRSLVGGVIIAVLCVAVFVVYVQNL